MSKRTIALPDNRTIELNGDESPEKLKAIKDKIRSTYTPEQLSSQQASSSGGVEGGNVFEKTNELGTRITGGLARTVGRVGRLEAAGAAALVDTALLLPKTIANAVELGLESAGFEGSALEQMMERIRTNPTLREQVLTGIDKVTDNKLQPKDNFEKATDFVGEFLAITPAVSKVTKDPQKVTTGIKQAVKTVVNPLEELSGQATPKIAQSQGIAQLTPSPEIPFAVQAQRGKQIRLSKGQATQDPKVQELEDLARTRTIGEKAFQETVKFDTAQQGDIFNAFNQLLDNAQSPEDVAKLDDKAQEAIDIVRKKRAKLKKAVKRAYDKAQGIARGGSDEAFQEIEGATRTEELTSGKPVKFEFIRNTEKAPNLGSTYGQDIEPSGRYMLVKDKGVRVQEGWESGTVAFKKPLVIDNDGLNWKKVVSKQYGGKTGRELSEALAEDGYDGIITTDGKYGVSEVIDLTMFSKKTPKGSKAVGIRAKELQDDFINILDEALIEKGVKPNEVELPISNSLYKQLKDSLNKGKTTSVKLKALEDWRKRVTAQANGNKGSAEAVSLNIMKRQYDEFMAALADEAIIEGDQSAINAFRKARGLRARLGRIYESNKLVDTISKNGDETIETMTTKIFAASKFSGQKQAAATVKALKKAARGDADKVNSMFKEGIVGRLLSYSKSDLVIKGTDIKSISIRKLATNLDDLLDKNFSLVKEVFDADEIKVLREIQSDLTKAKSKQLGTTNPSGSGKRAFRLFSNLINNSVVRVAGDIAAPVGNALSAKGVRKSFADEEKMLSMLEKQIKKSSRNKYVKDMLLGGAIVGAAQSQE